MTWLALLVIGEWEEGRTRETAFVLCCLCNLTNNCAELLFNFRCHEVVGMWVDIIDKEDLCVYMLWRALLIQSMRCGTAKKAFMVTAFLRGAKGVMVATYSVYLSTSVPCSFGYWFDLCSVEMEVKWR